MRAFLNAPGRRLSVGGYFASFDERAASGWRPASRDEDAGACGAAFIVMAVAIGLVMIITGAPATPV